MKDQPWDLNQTWPVGRNGVDLQMPPKNKFRGVPPPKKLGRKKNFLPLFRDFRTQHRISPGRNVASTNQNASVNLLCVDLFPVTFDPETVEIHSVILTHPSAAITLQPSKLRHIYSLFCVLDISHDLLTASHRPSLTLSLRVTVQALKYDEGYAHQSLQSSNDSTHYLACELTKSEFADSLGLQPDSTFVTNMFKMIDKSDNGYISFREFLDFFVIFSTGESITDAAIVD